MNQQRNKVRIIGGAYRRRLLAFPDSIGLRPTPDRVRETLFNWLGQDLTSMRCLDLFSGSGALGFEAASRGAARVVMVEKNRQVAEVLRSNLQLLGANTIDVQCMDALHYMKGRQERFDVVFLDPPYDSGLLRDVLPGMSELLTPQGVVYLEARDWPELEGWEVLREGKAGLVHYALICRPGSKEETS